MEDYLEDACAPQWMDFTEPCNLKVTQDFFNKVDTTESKEKLPDSNSKNIQPTSQEDVSPSNAITKMQEDLRNIKSIPVKMTPNCDNKKVVTAITYDKVYTDAIRTLEFCQRPTKNRDASNKINQESTVFKTSGVSKITKSSKSIASYNVFNQCVQSSRDIMLKPEKINEKMKNVNMRRTLPSHYLFKLDAACVKNNASKVSHACLLDYNNNKERDKELNEHSDGLKKESNEELNGESNEEHEKKNNDEFKNENGDRNEEDNKEQQNELMDDNKDEEGNNQDDVDITIGKTKRRQSNKLPSLLTWQNHRRRSMYKRRSSTSTSLAEAIPCFQNETPKRFRARNTKNNTPALINPSKLMENRVPISSTLISTGACAVIVPSQEERRKPKLEKKIKAKPVPPDASRMSPKVAKKPASTYSATQSKSDKTACNTNLPRRKNLPPPASHGKTSSGSKNTVPKIMVTDTEGIIVEHQAISFFGVPKEKRSKSVTRVQPFSFEERNKALQMKKEQRLKNLQENNVIKRKFRARPAPNFSKPMDASRRRKNVDSSNENKNTQETKNAACAIDKRKRK